jgi:two-component system, sensor histidine kinase
MKEGASASPERRVLALGPSGKDAVLLQSVLAEASIECVNCTGSSELLRELEAGAGALILSEESVTDGARGAITSYLQQQPQWSELPVLVLMSRTAASRTLAQLMELLGNVTLIERPMRIALLLSAIRTALRAREKQYQIRAYIAERERIERSLRDADRRKDEFLAALAHELRNPLAPILNALRLLQHFDSATPQARWARDVIDRQARQLTRLVDDLLDVSRITRGKISLRKEVLELEGMVRSAIETSRPLIEAARHELRVQLPEYKVTLEADPVRLAQALSNLLNNAAKYTPEGGQITVTAAVEGSQVVICVRDTGIGISADMLPQVFELFAQADQGLERSQGGLGIGLTLVQTFIEMHDGSVEAHSAGTGSGSEFVIRLPVLSNDARVPPLHKPGDQALRFEVPRRVLIVDDNQDGARSLAMVLQMGGNDVYTVYDGPDAVEAFSRFRPDVVLLDVGLPTLNGYDTARLMRKLPDGSGTLIIALTGWGTDEDRRRSREAGINHHLVKPVDLKTLHGLLGSRQAV